MLSSQNPNFSDRLIRIIERNAEQVTQSTVKKLQSSPRTSSYHEMSSDDLHSRVYEVYHNLGLWLLEKSTEAVRAWYNALGEKRCEEGVPLAEVLWALVLTKDRLLEYLAANGLVDSAMELYQQREFDRLIAHFFDRAACYAAEGYERRASRRQTGSPAVAVH